MSSVNDRAILDAILSPFLPGGNDFSGEDVKLTDDIPALTKEIIDARQLEKEAVCLTEEKKIEEALKLLTTAANLAPKLSSVYNNRAQVYRLIGDTEKALADLNLAIELSGGKGKSGCQALCQRGSIHRKEGRDEEALRDFKAAAELGSPFAKMQLVQLNPYAALCNQMLSQVMDKLKNVPEQ